MTNHRFTKLSVSLFALALSAVAEADTLKDAIECAMRLNPDVRYAAVHRLTTEEQLKQQKAGYLPTLDIAAGGGFQDTDSPLTSPTTQNLYRSQSSATLNQNLFNGFATTNEVRRLKATVKAAAYKTGGTAEDVALKVTEQYLEILRREKLVALADENLSSVQGVQGMIGERTKAGVGKAADLNQADGRLSLAKASLIAEQGNLTDAKTSYMRVVGIAPEGLSMPAPPGAESLPKTEDEAVAEAIKMHPTLKSANADIVAARAQHETAKSPNYPQVDLLLMSNRNRNIDGLPGVDNDDRAMLLSTWNLFKGGKDLARQRETAYEIQEATDVRNRTLWEVEETTRLSWNAWHVAAERASTLAKYRDYSNSTVGAYLDQFKLGQRTLLDLLNSQEEYFRASSDYVTAQYTELYARYRLLNSLGRLMEYVGVARPVEANPAVHLGK